MKTRFAISVFASLAGITLLILGTLVSGLRRPGGPTPENQESVVPADSLFQRPDVVFILGRDELAENPYYRLAYQYYQAQSSDTDRQLVTHCRSLQEVRDYLVRKATGPWGEIHLVVHGNQWNGLGVPVVPDGPRSTATNLGRAQNISRHVPEQTASLDPSTELILHACGTGNDPELLEALSQFFGGKLCVRSSKYFVTYDARRQAKELAEYWFTTYRTGLRPIDPLLAEQLEQEHPDVQVDWLDALQRTTPRFPGDLYHYRFSVPVRWTVTFPEEANLPVLDTEEQRQIWLASLDDLQSALAETGIHPDRFNWQLEQTVYATPDGSGWPAIAITGKSSVLCILRSLPDTGPEPVFRDSRYYAAYEPTERKVFSSQVTPAE